MHSGMSFRRSPSRSCIKTETPRGMLAAKGHVRGNHCEHLLDDAPGAEKLTASFPQETARHVFRPVIAALSASRAAGAPRIRTER